jgi:hypothetical protein
VLPSQEWKKQRFKKPEQQKWYAGETISIGIGQGYNAYTPIQLAQATATLANNGVMFRPHLVQNIVDTRNGEKRPVEPKPLRDLGWKQKNLDVIHRAMIGVNKEGTGTRAFAGAPYSVGGKTGTAQVFSLKGPSTRNRPSRSTCATTPCSSPTPPPTIRRSPSPCWSRTAVSAPSPPPRSPAWCSTTICWASCRPAPPGGQRCHRGGARGMMDVVGTLRRAWANAVAHLDFPLLLITAAIMAIGLGTVYSATYDSTTA